MAGAKECGLKVLSNVKHNSLLPNKTDTTNYTGITFVNLNNSPHFIHIIFTVLHKRQWASFCFPTEINSFGQLCIFGLQSFIILLLSALISILTLKCPWPPVSLALLSTVIYLIPFPDLYWHSFPLSYIWFPFPTFIDTVFHCHISDSLSPPLLTLFSTVIYLIPFPDLYWHCFPLSYISDSLSRPLLTLFSTVIYLIPFPDLYGHCFPLSYIWFPFPTFMDTVFHCHISDSLSPPLLTLFSTVIYIWFPFPTFSFDIVFHCHTSNLPNSLFLSFCFIIIIIIITIIIIMAFKGTIRDFFNLLTVPRTVSNTYAQAAWAKSCANHVQHIEHLSHATCRVMSHAVRRDSSTIKFDRVEITFI